jgi:hypothetical protein
MAWWRGRRLGPMETPEYEDPGDPAVLTLDLSQ